MRLVEVPGNYAEFEAQSTQCRGRRVRDLVVILAARLHGVGGRYVVLRELRDLMTVSGFLGVHSAGDRAEENSLYPVFHKSHNQYENKSSCTVPVSYAL